MSSWLGWILILAGIYLVAVIGRGIIQLMAWLSEELLSNARHRKRLEERSKHPLPRVDPATSPASGSHRKTAEGRGVRKERILVSAARIALFHWLVAPAEFARMVVSSRRYDYWVASALAAEDPRKKVKYLSKALTLAPDYRPAWGLKANALLALGRYEEALQCFEKVLAMAPSAIAWHKKGLCCHHLGRYEEAVECFDKALAACPDATSDLREDAFRGKKLAEKAMSRNGTA